MNYGFIKSKIDGSEKEFELLGIQIPKEYSYLNCLPKVLDLKNNPICVPCSISTYIDWKINLQSGNKENNQIDLYGLFEKYGTEEGMSIKDALNHIKHYGIIVNNKTFRIKQYATIGSIDQLKEAIIANGPCIAALPVYKDVSDFWNGYSYSGGHAIAIVGYDDKGFIIRNSWGTSYGYNGYYHILNKDFNKFYEIWTLI